MAQRWILARLRHETFFSMAALNARIRELCDALNDRPRKHLGGVSRRELFERIERSALKPLPEAAFSHRPWKKVRPNSDYHVEVDFHWYSVPYALAHEEREACVGGTTMEVRDGNSQVASHARRFEKSKHTTDPQPRAPNHQAWAERDPGGLLAWAEKVGPNTTEMMQRILRNNLHRDQTWRSGRALMRVARPMAMRGPRLRARELFASARPTTSPSSGC